MRKLQTQQRGMTFLGYVIVLGVIGFFAIMIMKLVPIYLEHQSIVAAMNAVSQQPPTSTAQNIRSSIEKRFDVDSVKVIRAADVKIRREKGKTVVAVDYEAKTPFIGNLYLMVKFSESVELKGN